MAKQKNKKKNAAPEMTETKDEKQSEAAAAEDVAKQAAEQGAAGEASEPTEEAASAEASGQAESEEKQGFFKKKEKADPKDEKIAELTDRLQRQMAEFDNYRKRTDKEKSSMYQIGAKDVIEKILPVVDNFERGLAAGDGADPFVDGMNKIYKQMMTQLEELGVTVIEAVGCEFDPNLHNAVMHADDESVGENIITEEFQKGYMYKDSVVRHSMVKVAN